jgi:hypothetical protein
MTVAILVITALSLAVQLAIAGSLLLMARAFHKGLTEPLPVRSAQPEKPRIRLVGDGETS